MNLYFAARTYFKRSYLQRLYALAFVVLVAASIGGCGQMGPLYQPPAESPEGKEEP